MEELISYIKQYVELDSEETELIASSFREAQVKKGEILQPDLQANPYFGFIVSGILKLFMLDSAGNESSLCFCVSNHFFGSPKSVSATCTDTDFSMKAVTKADLLMIYVKDFAELTAQIPKLSALQTQIYAGSYLELATRSQKIQTEDATRRYLQFIEQQPEVAKHATAQDIASYLQLSRETISRIRKKISAGEIM